MFIINLVTIVTTWWVAGTDLQRQRWLNVSRVLLVVIKNCIYIWIGGESENGGGYKSIIKRGLLVL
ncbi:hypothetical protein HanHA300_Chr08g0289481 [Helianthus annuus]|nr:hypothetical protein HanHA300_Chr08g0289481 [Helianthus annuus]KAJ0554439.1 hypothetical protein HanHA89_Chr08g0307781 [Helianthus annuus]